MIRIRAIAILALALLAMMGISAQLVHALKDARQSYDRVMGVNDKLNRKLSVFQTENGRLVAQNEVLRLRENELEALIPQMTSEIDQMGVKLSRVESVSTSGFQISNTAIVALKDSLILDTLSVKVFDFSDGYFNIHGWAKGDQQHLQMSYQDTLVQVVYHGERYRPWLWIFSKRKLMQRVSLKNPNASIHYTQHIEILD